METLTYNLAGVVPPSSATGVRFTRLEIPRDEISALAVVWFTLWNDHQERGVRIDLQKQVFLDDFEEVKRDALNSEARLVVNFVSSLATRQGIAAALATRVVPALQQVADPWHRNR